MKRIITFISVFALLLTACEGDPGPPGFDGRDGLNGGPQAINAFEIVLDFNDANDYSFAEAYGFDVPQTHLTLVYILWETIDGQEIWRVLPQTVQFNDGNLVYNYDFTQVDVRFFLEGTTNFSTLDPSFIDAQTFRVVVAPANNVGRLDMSDLNVVMDMYGITEFEKR